MKQHPLCTDCENPGTPLDLPLPIAVKREWVVNETRRRFLGRSGKVLGWAALAGLFSEMGLELCEQGRPPVAIGGGAQHSWPPALCTEGETGDLSLHVGWPAANGPF